MAKAAESRAKKMKREQTANTVTFAERLKNLMLERWPTLTQKALAETADVTPGAVSRWLRQSRHPYQRHVHKICAVLGVQRQWLETGDGEKWLPKVHIHAPRFADDVPAAVECNAVKRAT